MSQFPIVISCIRGQAHALAHELASLVHGQLSTVKRAVPVCCPNDLPGMLDNPGCAHKTGVLKVDTR